MTKEDFVDLLIAATHPDSTDAEQEAAVRVLSVEEPEAALTAFAGLIQGWLIGLESDCDSACDRDHLHQRFREALTVNIEQVVDV